MSKLSKTLIYGGNFIFPSLAKILNEKAKLAINPSLANPYGAVFYAGLDLLGTLSGKIKDSAFTRLSKAAGFGYYGISTAADLFSIAGGDYKDFAQLPFDVSMAYQLGKETFGIYDGNSISKDLISIKDSCKKLVEKIPKKNKGYAKVKIRNK